VPSSLTPLTEIVSRVLGTDRMFSFAVADDNFTRRTNLPPVIHPEGWRLVQILRQIAEMTALCYVSCSENAGQHSTPFTATVLPAGVCHAMTCARLVRT